MGWNFRSSDRALPRPHQIPVRSAAQFAYLALTLSNWMVVAGSIEDFDAALQVPLLLLLGRLRLRLNEFAAAELFAAAAMPEPPQQGAVGGSVDSTFVRPTALRVKWE